MAQQELLRQIPKVDDLLSRPDLTGQGSPYIVAQATREILDGLRRAILAEECAKMPSHDDIAGMISAQITRENTPSLRRVINATGVILHTNLGRAPLADSAVRAASAVADGYSTLEYDAVRGERGDRHAHVAGLLTRLTGAEDALVINNNAAAVLLMLAALAHGRQVIVSRGELVEIGGSFRIPQVMEQSGCILREVGTTNRTGIYDYEQAIDPEQTGALLKAHTSNYKILGFTREVQADELAALGAKHSLPFLYDLGSGAMLPLSPFGVSDEPCVSDCVSAADVVCFSGDKLLGGPQAGIIVGKKAYLDRMKKHPLARALRIDKLTLAALEATLRLYFDPEQAIREIPVLRMLSASRDSLRASARRLAALLEPVKDQFTIVDNEGQVGGGCAPTQVLPSVAIAFSPRDVSVAELERRLRCCEPAIIARVAKDRLLIDVRTINEADFDYIARKLISLLSANGQ